MWTLPSIVLDRLKSSIWGESVTHIYTSLGDQLDWFSPFSVAQKMLLQRVITNRDIYDSQMGSLVIEIDVCNWLNILYKVVFGTNNLCEWFV